MVGSELSDNLFVQPTISQEPPQNLCKNKCHAGILKAKVWKT